MFHKRVAINPLELNGKFQWFKTVEFPKYQSVINCILRPFYL